MSAISTVVRIGVELQGLPPGLLFQGKGIMELKKDPKRTRQLPPEEEAYHRAHWMTVKGKKQLCIPWCMFHLAFSKAGANFKFTGRKSFESILPATLSCESDCI